MLGQDAKGVYDEPKSEEEAPTQVEARADRYQAQTSLRYHSPGKHPNLVVDMEGVLIILAISFGVCFIQWIRYAQSGRMKTDALIWAEEQKAVWDQAGEDGYLKGCQCDDCSVDRAKLDAERKAL